MANGQLDISQLSQIDGEPGDLLRADACGYWNALQRDFRHAMGYGIQVREAYRPLGTQIGYFVTRYTKTSRNTGLYYDGTFWVKKPGVPAAARPGTSKHGDGLAVDVNVDSFTSPAYRWLAANAGRYGFGNNQGRNDGEPWHWVFGETRPTINIAPAGLNTQEIDDMPSAKEVVDELLNRTLPNPANNNLETKISDLIRYTEWATVVRRDEIMARLAQIVEWLDTRLTALGIDRDADTDALLASLKAVTPGDTTVLADLTPVLAALESLKASLPAATRKAFADSLSAAPSTPPA
jgi:hypothetical protein